MTTHDELMKAVERINRFKRNFPVSDQQYIETLITAATRQAWQPIETAPVDCTEILLSGKAVEPYDGMYVCEGYGWTDGDEKTLMRHFSTSQGKLVNQPTHWMPLPSAPTGEK